MTRNNIGDNIHGSEILLPVATRYILLTVFVAVLLQLVPMPGFVAWVWPDFVALVLVYWGVYQPRRLGILSAWVLGLVMDVGDASLFGQHALAYSVLMYGAIFLHRRIRMFALPYQTAHVAAMLIVQQLLQLLIRLVAGADFPGVTWFAASLTGAALWPVLVAVLKIPLQRRANPDDV